MLKVIVNADDFGWDENRTKAILEAYRIRAVTTTTVMVNMPWFERAIEMARDSGLYENIGLHLCLTEGMPLTNAIKRSRLFCNEDGAFNGRFHCSTRYRLYLPLQERLALREEIEAQMRRYVEAGLPMMHIDSHHHAHTDLSVARELLPIALKFGFKTIRRSRDFGANLTLSKRLYKRVFNLYQSHFLSHNADRFGTFDDFVNKWRELPDGAVVEVMTHPLFYDLHKKALSMNGDLMDSRSPLDRVVNFWKEYHNQIFAVGLRK